MPTFSTPGLYKGAMSENKECQVGRVFVWSSPWIQQEPYSCWLLGKIGRVNISLRCAMIHKHVCCNFKTHPFFSWRPVKSFLFHLFISITYVMEWTWPTYPGPCAFNPASLLWRCDWRKGLLSWTPYTSVLHICFKSITSAFTSFTALNFSVFIFPFLFMISVKFYYCF